MSSPRECDVGAYYWIYQLSPGCDVYIHHPIVLSEYTLPTQQILILSLEMLCSNIIWNLMWFWPLYSYAPAIQWILAELWPFFNYCTNSASQIAEWYVSVRLRRHLGCVYVLYCGVMYQWWIWYEGGKTGNTVQALAYYFKSHQA